MTENEKLDLLLSEMHEMKSDMQDMKSYMQDMKSEMQDMKSDMKGMKSELQETNRRITNVELHLENHTDRNIQLLAENFINLTNKLNQAIPAADKNLSYEVKVDYLARKVQGMEKDISELKTAVAQGA